MAIIQNKAKKEDNNQQQKEIKENRQRNEVLVKEQKFKPKRGEKKTT